MKLDILAIVAHPDDAELACSGTLHKMSKLGFKTGIVDLTQGELGTRGSIEIRKDEAEHASTILGVHIRENLGLLDGFFENNKENQLPIITIIRKYQPKVIITNAIADRHPDHVRAAKLVSDSCFLSGLLKIETKHNGKVQPNWRPYQVFNCIQDQQCIPNIVIDITESYDAKINSIKAFKSQFYDPNSPEPATYISSPLFFEQIEARAKMYGYYIGVKYGEGFTYNLPIKAEHLLQF